MKIIKLILFVVLFLVAACAVPISKLIPSAPTKGVQNTPLARQQVQATQTAGPTPTATPDWQAAYSVAATNERAAQIQLESVNIEIARITQQAAQNEIDLLAQKNEADRLSLSDKQTSINATQTAFPIIATEQNDRREDQIRLQVAQSTAAASLPTQTWANANSETYAKNADKIKAAELALQWVMIALGVAFTIFMLLVSIATVIKASRPVPVVNLNPKGYKPIPQIVNKVNPNATKVLKTVIPCSPDQLLFLADWIVNKKMTLGLKSLEGTPVHKRMIGEDNLRDWLIWNEFAHELKSKQTGEIYMFERGVDFFEDTLAFGQAPMFEDVQFTCRDENQTTERGV